MSNKKQVIEIVEPSNPPTYGFNKKALVAEGEFNGETIDASTGELVVEEHRKRGPGRPPKNSSSSNTYIDDHGIVSERKTKNEEAQFEKGYQDTTKMLYGTIMQADSMYADLGCQLQNYKDNRSYGGRNRMMQMSEFMNTQVSLINTKITAVRELNSIRNKINDLKLKKMQMDKETLDDNSDKAVMDAYYALINASNYGLPPMQSPLSPASINTGVAMNGTRINTMPLGQQTQIIPANPDPMPPVTTSADASFNNYKENLTPIQRKMILDNDPNIKTVVVYDQSSGNKYFDIVNVQTGQSVPGVQRPADFLLDNMRIDARNGIAVNSNINQSFPLVITGSRVADEL